MKDRIIAGIANLNMKIDVWKPTIFTVLTGALAACQPTDVLPSTSPEPGGNNNNSSEFDQNKPKTGEEWQKESLASFLSSKPEYQGREMFAINVKFPLKGIESNTIVVTPDETDKAEIKSYKYSFDGKELQPYTDAIVYTMKTDENGKTEWVRLAGVWFPTEDGSVNTAWYYSRDAFKPDVNTVNFNQRVLGFNSNSDQFVFWPLVEPPYTLDWSENIGSTDVSQFSPWNGIDPYTFSLGTIPTGFNKVLFAPVPFDAPTQTPAPTESPTASYENMEKEYISTLTPEQMALYEQYGSKDRTSEGLVRRFLEHKGLNTYLAYVDVKPDSKDLNEVVAVWNDETKSTNPALLIGDNVLFINGSTKSDIKFTKAGAEATLEKYFDYARANMIALSKGVNLPNDLDVALADPQAIEFLTDGAQVNLRAVKSENYVAHKYNVPSQLITVSKETAIVFKTVTEPNPNMFLFIPDSERYFGYSIEQTGMGSIEINYFSKGGDTLQSPNQDMLLAHRIYRISNHLFFRASNNDALDIITQEIIFNNNDLSTSPLLSYTK